MRVRDALGPLFRDEDFQRECFAGMFSDLGQPGLSPGVLAMVTVLQFLYNLSDREAVAAIADRISWKYALGVSLDGRGFDPSVLSEFRARLAGPGRADGLLDVVLDRLKEAGLVRAGGRARTDSTHVIAAVRRLGRIELVGESVRAALEEIAGISENWIVPLLDAGWHERYGRKVELARLLGRGGRKTTAEKLAAQIAADGQALLAAIEADQTAAWLRELPRVVILRKVWDQQFKPAPGGGLVLKSDTELAASAQRIHSPYDPEARYSSKAAGTKWVGSKAHLTESCDLGLPHMITDVHTAEATCHDATATTPIQDKLIARGLRPATHLVDAGYSSAGNFADSGLRGITLIAPVVVATGHNAKNGTFNLADFDVDWERGVARCPNGAESHPMRPVKQGKLAFGFATGDCVPCPIRAQCTQIANPKIARTFTTHPEPVHKSRIEAYRAQDTTAWRTQYNARAGIEGTISEAVRRSDLRKSRYCGLAKAHVQNIATGLAINVHRLGAYLGPTIAPRRPSRVHQLCVANGIINET